MKIIDCHAHIFPDVIASRAVDNLEGHYKMPWQKKGTLEDIKDSLKGSGIYKAVIIATPTKPSQVINNNNFLHSIDGGQFICFGSVHPDYEDCKGEIQRVKDMGLHGFKFHPDFQAFNIDDDKALAIYEEIGPSYPILLHTGDETLDYSHPRRLARVLEIFPKHTFIAAHLGGYSAWEDSKKYLLGKNLYIDTSSSMCKLNNDQMVELIRLHGADKVLFGTDYPAVGHLYEVERFKKLDLTEEEQEKILWKNAMKLFKIEE